MLSHNNICVFCIQCINKGDVVFISSRVSDDYVCACVCVYVVGFYQHMHTKLPFTHCRCHFAAMYTIFHQRFAWFRVLLSDWGFACILTEQIFTTRQFSVSFCRVSVRTHQSRFILSVFRHWASRLTHRRRSIGFLCVSLVISSFLFSRDNLFQKWTFTRVNDKAQINLKSKKKKK